MTQNLTRLSSFMLSFHHKMAYILSSRMLSLSFLLSVKSYNLSQNRLIQDRPILIRFEMSRYLFSPLYSMYHVNHLLHTNTSMCKVVRAAILHKAYIAEFSLIWYPCSEKLPYQIILIQDLLHFTKGKTYSFRIRLHNSLNRIPQQQLPKIYRISCC